MPRPCELKFKEEAQANDLIIYKREQLQLTDIIRISSLRNNFIKEPEGPIRRGSDNNPSEQIICRTLSQNWQHLRFRDDPANHPLKESVRGNEVSRIWIDV